MIFLASNITEVAFWVDFAVSDPKDGSITNERDRPVIEALCNAAVSTAGGQIELGHTEVETRCFVNDDVLHKISINEAFSY